MAEAPRKPADTRSLVDRCRAGDEDAAQQLFDHYVNRLLPLARVRLSQRVASRVDAEDIVQSVFRTFFKRLKAGEFQIEEADDLCKLLVRITVHKTLRQISYHRAGKRDCNLETRQTEESQSQLFQTLGRDPGPEVCVAFLNQLEHFLGQLKPDERQVLELRMQGHSNEEIAQQLGTYDRKIRRVIERVRTVAEAEGLGT
jgi:RNA polymerase sigma-70 factor (ECF subfamily)